MNKTTIPIVFTPSNEPYLGRTSVHEFDNMIIVALERNRSVAKYTKENTSTLSDLQHAACQLIPHGFNIALSIRELVRQAYLYGAVTLLRPLVERAAIISYICENDIGIKQWKSGWKHNNRPSLKQMMKSIGPLNTDDDIINITKNKLNSIVHGDPAGASYCIEFNSENKPAGHPVGKILNNPNLCDDVCFQSLCYVTVLIARMTQIFPKSTRP